MMEAVGDVEEVVVGNVGEDDDKVVEVDDVSCRRKMAPRAVLLDKAMEIRARFTGTCIVGVSLQKAGRVGDMDWKEENKRQE